MSGAYLLLPLLGLLWTLVAVVIGEARQRNVSIRLFYFSGAVVAAAALWGLALALGLEDLTAPQYRGAVVCFAAAAVANGLGQALTMYNLSRGGRALAYSIPQLAFLLPYFWSVCFLNQRPTWAAAGGLALIAAAVMFLAAKKQSGGAASSSLPLVRVLLSLGAMVVVGTGHILMMIPTQFAAERTLAPWTGACVLQSANAGFFLIWALLGRQFSLAELRRAGKFGIGWGLCAAASFCVLLPALRLLGERHQAGIVFPVGCGMVILCYTLFTVIRYREKQTWSQFLAYGALVAGIFLIRA